MTTILVGDHALSDRLLVWNTFLGGGDWESVFGITVDENGYVYLAGSGGWSTWGNPVRPYTSLTDGFAVKLSPTGALVWNTF